MIKNCKLGKNVKIHYKNLVNLYGCEIGDNTMIGPFVEIQKGSKIGKNCKIESHTFICEGVTIGDHVFVGHGVVFINDKYPNVSGKYDLLRTTVKDRASIGSNATILPVEIGANSMVGAGSVVTKYVPEGKVVFGNPARIVKSRKYK